MRLLDSYYHWTYYTNAPQMLRAILQRGKRSIIGSSDGMRLNNKFWREYGRPYGSNLRLFID